MAIGEISEAVFSSSFASSSRSNPAGSNFMDNLRELYYTPDRVLKEMADPEVQYIELGGLGIFDKESSAFQLSSAVYFSRIETAINSIFTTLKQEDEMLKSLNQLVG